jgi:hypothetical protein
MSRKKTSRAPRGPQRTSAPKPLGHQLAKLLGAGRQRSRASCSRRPAPRSTACSGRPQRIFGTLSSNGRLVLVNPAGITVGAGAVVDTAGFTASTLGMSDADAAGRPAALRRRRALQVDGTIVARSGDVVLIAPKVQTGAEALVQSQWRHRAGGRPEGGDHRPRPRRHRAGSAGAGNEAVNLGTLNGDAVGMFAGTLKHSGLVQQRA